MWDYRLNTFLKWILLLLHIKARNSIHPLHPINAQQIKVFQLVFRRQKLLSQEVYYALVLIQIIAFLSLKITLLLVAHLGLQGIAPRPLYFFNWEMV
jgi:hypothetical protein